jgi:hypothetical protein
MTITHIVTLCGGLGALSIGAEGCHPIGRLVGTAQSETEPAWLCRT